MSENKENQNAFVPLYEKDKNIFFILTEDFVGETKEDAYNIGLGSMLVECILLRMNYTGEVEELDPNNIPHRKFNILKTPVAVISGPLFDKVS